jgi:hypothetical protein
MSGDEEETHGFMDVMPDPIESAFQKVVENAREWCPCCRTIRDFPKGKEAWEKVYVHTCHATIDAAAEAMLAAVDSLQFLNVERCFDAKATIHRLLKGESDALR